MITSIRELARIANVSRSTASLAIRNSPRLAAATRERVQRLAREHGYSSDPVVATLMSQMRVSRKVRAIEKLAYLISCPTRFNSREDTNALAYFEGANQRASSLGYELEKFWAKEPGLTQSRLSKILHARGIRGVIIAPLHVARGHVSLDWQYFAAATMTETIVKPDLHRTIHSHYRSMILVMRRLKQHGYRRIGYANTIFQDNLSNNAWLGGYLVQSHQHSAEPIPPLLLENWNKPAFREWLSRHRPDAIVSNRLEPLEMLRDLRVKVPEDVGYARLDLVIEGSPWSGIDQLPQQIGAGAVELVVAQLQTNQIGLPAYPKTQMINGIWRDGPTTFTSRPQPVTPRQPRSRRPKKIART